MTTFLVVLAKPFVFMCLLLIAYPFKLAVTKLPDSKLKSFLLREY